MAGEIGQSLKSCHASIRTRIQSEEPTQKLEVVAYGYVRVTPVLEDRDRQIPGPVH